MIYQILVDDRCITSLSRTAYRLRSGAAGMLGGYLPGKYAARIRALEGQTFDNRDKLIKALRSMIGPHRYSLIERYLPARIEFSDLDCVNATIEWDHQEDRRRTGAGFGYLADVMVERGMNARAIENPRARFYFTERGWQTVGRHVAAEARRLGHQVQVMKQKNPEPSQIVYSDQLQLAILPPRKNAAGR